MDKIRIETELYKGQDIILPGDIYKSEACNIGIYELINGVAHLRVDNIDLDELMKMSYDVKDMWLKHADDLLIIMSDYAKDYALNDLDKYRDIMNVIFERRKKMYEVYKSMKRVNPLYSLKEFEIEYILFAQNEFSREHLAIDIMRHLSYSKLLDYRAYMLSILNKNKQAMDYTYMLKDTEEYKEAKASLLLDRFEKIKDTLLHIEQIDRCIKVKEIYYKK